MRYYSQFGEDVAIAPLFKGRQSGFYVDIGSHDGVRDSNTLYFAKNHGFKGVCVEPHRVYYPRLVSNRSEAKCLNVAVWKEDLDEMLFYATAPGGWSRLEIPLPYADHTPVAVYKVKTITMRRLLQENDVPWGFDLLNIDVEGHEPEILSTFDIDEYMPRIVIIEDIRHVGFDDIFKDYYGVYGWKQRVGGSNIIYCLYEDDYRIVKERYRA